MCAFSLTAETVINYQIVSPIVKYKSDDLSAMVREYAYMTD